jgi:DNA-binding transcriptional LysR family regulator
VTPTKWVRIWNERLPRIPLDLIQVTAAEAAALVRNHDADAALLRLPIDPTGLHAIPLYSETTVVVVPKDHVVTAVEEVTADDLADELMLHPLDNTLDWAGLPGRQLDDRPATTAVARSPAPPPRPHLPPARGRPGVARRLVLAGGRNQ